MSLLVLSTQEPELLKEEKAQLERALQTTAVSQHGAFLGAADCLETISTELSSVCDHLDRLLQVSSLAHYLEPPHQLILPALSHELQSSISRFVFLWCSARVFLCSLTADLHGTRCICAGHAAVHATTGFHMRGLRCPVSQGTGRPCTQQAARQ